MGRGDQLQAVHEFEELEAMLEEFATSETVLEPPKEEFDRLVDQCRELNAIVPAVAEGTGVPYNQKDMAASIETQCDHGERAHRNQDQQAYTEAIQGLDGIRRYLIDIYQQVAQPTDQKTRAEVVLAVIRNLMDEISQVVPLAEAADRTDLQQELRTIQRKLQDIAKDVHRDTVRAGQKVHQLGERVEQIRNTLTPKIGHGYLDQLPEDHH
jgi:molecular chaperone DnaK